MKAWQHLKTINHHKILVMKGCFRVGLYKQGLLHDLSKYTPTEFLVGCKYFRGDVSPNNIERKDRGYSSAWLHHKGRNKHHLEYWYDEDLREQPIVPFKYCLEMVCDKLSASIVYEGKNWTKESELKYWNTREKDKLIINPKIRDFLTEVFTEVSIYGIDKVVNKEHLRKVYNKHCG